jgi:hypothetical protein
MAFRKPRAWDSCKLDWLPWHLDQVNINVIALSARSSQHTRSRRPQGIDLPPIRTTQTQSCY